MSSNNVCVNNSIIRTWKLLQHSAFIEYSRVSHISMAYGKLPQKGNSVDFWYCGHHQFWKLHAWDDIDVHDCDREPRTTFTIVLCLMHKVAMHTIATSVWSQQVRWISRRWDRVFGRQVTWSYQQTIFVWLGLNGNSLVVILHVFMKTTFICWLTQWEIYQISFRSWKPVVYHKISFRFPLCVACP